MEPWSAGGPRFALANPGPWPAQAPASFGLDADGEAYVVDYDGEVYHLEPAS